jgi:glycosyltransferase involved in cell wall biosynthesis
VDVERIVEMPAANVRAAFYLPRHASVVGNVAARSPDKGHHHLIDAALLVVRDVPDVRFVIVGDGELREGLENHVRDRHLERHVFLACQEILRAVHPVDQSHQAVRLTSLSTSPSFNCSTRWAKAATSGS